MLTFGEARKLLAKYANVGGLCPDPANPEVNLFVREVMQFALWSGQYQDLRRFDFVTRKGLFTVPEEVESIQKVKINNCPGNVWDKWFTFHSVNYLDGECVPPGNAIFEEPNYYPTAYDLPFAGARVGILGHCNEAEDAHCIVQGKDLTDRQIITMHKGEQIYGEYLTIKKGQLQHTQNCFAQITGIVLSKTNGYKTLYWLKPDCSQKGFLSDYTPFDEHPEYRRYRLTTPNCCPEAFVSILARIRLKSYYADEEKIPFDNILALKTAAQAINASGNNDVQTAAAKTQFMNTLIQNEQNHKRVQPGQPLNIAIETSPGLIRNTIGPWGGFGTWRRGGSFY